MKQQILNRFLLVGMLVLALTACAPEAPRPTPVSTVPPASTPAPSTPPTLAPTLVPVVALPEVTIEAADYSYNAPEKIPAGWVRVRLVNNGQEPHHVQFLRLNDGVTFAQFQEALMQGEGPALALVSQVGGVGSIAPGLAAQAVLNLPAGEYVLLCFIPSATDGMPHLAKGMILTTTVEAIAPGATEPSADLSVTLRDFMFDMPDNLPAGPITIKVTNSGPEPHELNILRLAEGKTADDVTAYLAAPDGPPLFVPVGGMNGLDVGATGYIEFDFVPGTYVAICNIPSPKAEGHPHFALGMIRQFTVSASSASNFPTGKFVKSYAKDYGMIFNADGTYSVFTFGGSMTLATGTYEVDGGTFIQTTDNSGCATPMTFNYTYDGTNLTFSYVGDPKADQCDLRRGDFDNVTYVKVEP